MKKNFRKKITDLVDHLNRHHNKKVVCKEHKDLRLNGATLAKHLEDEHDEDWRKLMTNEASVL